MKVTRQDEQLASHAYLQALNSPCLHKHGCVASVNGKIIGRGFNNYRLQSNDPFKSPGCSCHAEMDTLRRIYREFRPKISSQLKVV